MNKGKRPRMGKALVFAILEGWLSATTLGTLMVAVFLLVEGRFQPATLGWMLPALAVVMVARFFLGIQANYQGQVLGAGYIRKLRMDLGEHLRQVPLGFFARHRAGDLTSRLMGNIRDVESVITHLYTDMTTAGVASLGLALGLLWVDWRMALVALAVVPLFFPLSWLSTFMAQRFGSRRFSTMAELNDRFVEFLQGIRVLKAHGLGLSKLEGLKGAIDANMRANIAVELVNAPVIIGFQVILELAFLGVVLAGLVWLGEGSLRPAHFLVGVLAAFQFFRPLKALTELQALYRNHQRAGKTIESIFAEPRQTWDETAPTAPGPAVEFQGVGFGYAPQRPVVHDLSFSLAEGTVTALVGPSGSGKSTVANLIMRLWDPLEGRLLVRGRDVRDWPPEALLSQMAVVFQDVYLFHDTVRANIAIGRPGATEAEIVEVARRAQADEFIRSLPQGYDTLLAEGGSSLSGGERQRIAIARCLLKDAPLILLDEATASLDPENERSIQQALAELVRGRTVLVIAHRLRTIKSAHQILVLDQGRLAAQGSHDQLLVTCELYRRLWTNQEAVLGWALERSSP